MRILLLTLFAILITAPAFAQNAIHVNSPTVLIVAADVTANVALPNAGGRNLMITNDSDGTCFLKAGIFTITAAVTDLPVLGGSIQVFSHDAVNTHLAVICGAGVAGTIYISQGPGE